MINILISFGTRPEYIKIKPLLDKINCKTLFTGQHIDLLKNVDCDYKIHITNESNNRLNNVIASIMLKENIFNDIDYVLVQGDTSSALAVALSAFNNRCKIIHLEAGLRTFNNMDPYPEEMNRKLISQLANIHLCPTKQNIINLNKEGITENIYLTGNTELDNIIIKDRKKELTYSNKIIITLHRRDNHHNIKEWFETLSSIASEHKELEFIIPLHPNPNIQKYKKFLKYIKVIEPQPFEEFIKLCKICKFIISDSGGIQEDASHLNKKIIICRKTTERPEILGIWGTLCPEPNMLKDIFELVNEDYLVNSDEKCPFIHNNIKSADNIINVLNTLE